MSVFILTFVIIAITVFNLDGLAMLDSSFMQNLLNNLLITTREGKG
jgi:hypothetical protein